MLVVYVNSPVVELLLYLTESGFIPNDFNISKSLGIVTLSPTEKFLKSINFLSGIFVAAEIGTEYEKSRVSTINKTIIRLFPIICNMLFHKSSFLIKSNF